MKANKTTNLIQKISLGFLATFSIFFVIQNIFANSLELQTSLFDWWFTGINNTYSTTHFNQSWNNFQWLFLRNEPVYLGHEQEVIINWSSKFCNQEIQGLYYNNTRWERLRPLSQDDLIELQSKDSSYDNLTITGWFYNKCNWEDRYQIYGQLTHTRNGIDYKLLAGIEIIGNTYNSNFQKFHTGFRHQSLSWPVKADWQWPQITAVDFLRYLPEHNARYDDNNTSMREIRQTLDTRCCRLP